MDRSEKQSALPKPRHSTYACLRKPIIPYVSEVGDDADVLAKAAAVFLHVEELTHLEAAVEPFRKDPLKRVALMLHLDLVRGLAREDAALKHVSSLGRVDGIITVHHHLVTPARRLGLLTIMRLFLQDSRSIDRGLAIIERASPDAVELLPSVAAIQVAERFRRLRCPKIAGGLVYKLSVVQEALDSGCESVSTSDRELWQFNARGRPPASERNTSEQDAGGSG